MISPIKTVVFKFARRAWPCSRLCSYTAPYLPLTTTTACYASPTRRVWAGAHSNYVPQMTHLYVHQQARGLRFNSLLSSFLAHLRLCTRAFYLSVLFSPTIAMSPFINTFGIEFRRKWNCLFVFSLEKAGPAFIAWGRWAATRPDLFPRDLCSELSKLQNKTQIHSLSHTEKTIEKAFGRKLPEIFDDFEVAPIASGGISQTHRANLRFRYPTKQNKPITMSIKVRHPCIKESFKMDFAIVRQFAKHFRFLSPLKELNVGESLEQFEASMENEVDLSRRAARLAQLNINFHTWKDVSFPKPLFPLVHPDILVETYEEAESLSRYVDHEVELEVRIKKNIVLAGTRAVLQMLVVDNLIHAGMHPGNVLIRVDKGKHHIIFPDVSTTTEFPLAELSNFVKLFEVVGAEDGQNAAECLLRLSKRQNCPRPSAFIEDVEESFYSWDSEGGSVSSLEFMHRLLDKVRIHNVNIDQNFSTMITFVLSLEGWQQKFCPESRQTVMQGLDPLEFPWSAAGRRFLRSH